MKIRLKAMWEKWIFGRTKLFFENVEDFRVHFFGNDW